MLERPLLDLDLCLGKRISFLIMCRAINFWKLMDGKWLYNKEIGYKCHLYISGINRDNVIFVILVDETDHECRFFIYIWHCYSWILLT